jgi:hypothetical protein
MNRPQPEDPLGVALAQLNAALKAIFRRLRGRTTKTGGPEERPGNPPTPTK